MCDYICDAVAPAEVPGSEAPPSIGMVPSATDQNILTMLKEALETQKSDFYRQHSGTFTETTYTWLRWFPPGGENVVEISPASQILFDGDAIDSIQAFGFTVFEDENEESRDVYGAAIFQSEQPVLPGPFGIGYIPEAMDLNGCQTDGERYLEDGKGNVFLISSFTCERISG